MDNWTPPEIFVIPQEPLSQPQASQIVWPTQQKASAACVNDRQPPPFQTNDAKTIVKYAPQMHNVMRTEAQHQPEARMNPAPHSVTHNNGGKHLATHTTMCDLFVLNTTTPSTTPGSLTGESLAPAPVRPGGSEYPNQLRTVTAEVGSYPEIWDAERFPMRHVQMRRLHRKIYYTCLLCTTYTTWARVAMETHVKTTHKQSVFYCPYCRHSFHHWRSFRQHQSRFHVTNWKCRTCESGFNSEKALTYHQDTAHGPFKWACRLCGLQTPTKMAMGRHMRSAHQQCANSHSIMSIHEY